MPPQTRLGDNDTGHDACPPRGLATGSPDVIVNGQPAGRVGDSYPAHSCPAHPPHSGVIAAGSSTVFINDGELMPKDRLEKLFKPYEKGTKGNFGLGLSIVKRIVELHGGTIAAEPKENGNAFTVRLPKA